MTRFWGVLLGGMLLGCKADPSPAPQTTADPKSVVKELTAPHAWSAEMKLDGILDEAAWSTAASTGLFVDVSSGLVNASLPSQGEAKVFWTDTHLYVGFEVYDKTVKGGFPDGAVDPHLWERDTVEIMLDPDGDGDNKDYYEIQVGPQGLVFDSQFDDYNAPRGGPAGPFGHQEWSSGVERGVRVQGTMDNDSDTDDGYTVEIRIPWAAFTKAKKAPPAEGDAWRINFYAMQDNGGTAWSPILGTGNFHRAKRFGRIRFGK